MKRTLISSLVAALLISPALADDKKASTIAANKSSEVSTNTKSNINDKLLERIQIIGHSDGLRTIGGSATFLDESELDKLDYDDINRILASVPGVNIRQEDGYGLRPNIGFRGATPERSKKIALMEDGILIAPAPYSAAAAYYFPLVSRMSGIEVFKGPASIKYGPNTVAGALNMITRSVPNESAGAVDFAAGSEGYNKYHVHYGNTLDKFGFLIEAVKLDADGFKELDNGGKTGFDKNSLMVKLNYNLSGKGFDQLIELKLGYDDEVSNESYLGLTDGDFAENPNRRYSASQLDLMDWQHSNTMLTHLFETANYSVTTRLYRNDFKRSWNKLNGFKHDIALEDIIAKPFEALNPVFMEVITGQRDSEQDYETLVLGDNAREYFSHGLQSDFNANVDFLGLSHKLEIGIRYHVDEIIRRHTIDYYNMTAGTLVKKDDKAPKNKTFNSEKTSALSLYFQDSISLGDLTLTAGLRGEMIEARYQDTLNADDWLEKNSRIWLPGFSAFYQVDEQLGFLFGINKGYVPTSPRQDPIIKAEESINYELGLRFNDTVTNGELVAFFNDFSNLKESCTFSASSKCRVIDTEYNAGEVDIYGIEANVRHTFKLTDNIDMPVSVVYTYSKSEFKESFDSDFPLWGVITPGDEVPYLAKNQLTVILELASNAWRASLLTKYIGAMKETSGGGDSINFVGVSTAPLTIVDFSTSVDLGDGDDGSIYIKVDNIFDKVEIVSHRPYGARPSTPRTFVIGFKRAF